MILTNLTHKKAINALYCARLPTDQIYTTILTDLELRISVRHYNLCTEFRTLKQFDVMHGVFQFRPILITNNE